MERKEALVHFSGGLDSLLATCMMIEEGYRAVLITYNNGCMAGLDQVKLGYDRLVKRYGENSVDFWGYGLTVGYFKYLKDEFYQKTVEELSLIAPDLTMGQINCLTCRAAMYVFSVLVCQREGIDTVVDGARRSQGFTLERDMMIDKFRGFFDTYNIDFLVPVLDLKTDYERELSLLIRSFANYQTDGKCFLGVPITFESEDIMLKRDEEAVNIWNNNLEDKCHKLVKQSENIILDNSGRMF